MNNTLTALSGVRVGHATHLDKLTGCTVVLFDKPMPLAYKSYGGSPGTFNTDSMQNGKTFYRSNGVFVAGGSMTGLMSAEPIMQRMIRDGIGSKPFAITNPGIGGAIVFDLGVRVGQYDPKYGEEAYDNATSNPIVSGNVGAGTGTCVGQFHNLEMGRKKASMKGGVGSARVDVGNGIIVTAMSVVNCLGNVILPDGSILAGNRDAHKKFKAYEDMVEYVTSSPANTTISVVGINVDLKTRENYEKIAHFGTQGQVRAISPVHTSLDGDTVFVFSTQEITEPLNNNGKYFVEADDSLHIVVDILGNAAAKAVQESIYDACRSAETIQFEDAYQGVIPSCKDY